MKILVFGDIILDINLYGVSTRLAPEAPIPVINIKDTKYIVGGAGNVANNLLSLGCDVMLCSVVGDDDNSFIVKERINNEYIFVEKNRKTPTKHRTYIGNTLHSRYDIETTNDIDIETQNIIYDTIEKNMHNFDCIIISDYMKGIVTYNLCHRLICLFNTHNKYIFVDPKDTNHDKYKNCTFIKPNKNEAESITKTQINVNNAEENTFLIKKLLQCNSVMITFGENGLCINDDKFYYLDTNNKKEILDVTGAGDTVLSSYVYKFLQTKNPLLSAEFANYCGQIKVSHIGVYSITKYDELLFIKNNNKLIDYHNITTVINILHTNKKSIVFTNGCFDILHYGHIMYLQKAKKMGDVLIVGLNSDMSVKMNKGEKRPFNCEFYRIEQLKALECVDYVIVFNDKTPVELLKKINPDVYVKGGDYEVENLTGKEYAKKTLCLDYIDGLSTTNIMNDITQNNDNLIM